MANASRPDLVCERIARSQLGLITRGQALKAGLSSAAISRRLSSGRWERRFPGVFALAGVPQTWDQDVLAACLAGDDDTLGSHRCAAGAWEFDGFERKIVEVTTTRRIRFKNPRVIVHRVDGIPRAHRARKGPLPITTPTRTLLDLGAVCDADTVELALEDALRRGLTSVEHLGRALARHGGHGRRGAGVLRAILERRATGPPAESPLEVRFLQLMRASRLPSPVRQYEVREGERLIARVDCAYPDVLVAIEVDGYRYHGGRQAWQRDRVRGNELVRLGWRVLHLGSEDLRPERWGAMERTIRKALA